MVLRSHILAHKLELPTAEQALPGRSEAMQVPAGLEQAVFAMGCFWGAERRFWQQPGVWSTAVGYAGGHTPNPTYDETCSGLTGHTEVVLVVFDPQLTSYAALLKVFWEAHNPTQGMRQGNDTGSQYRSAIYCYGAAQLAAAQASQAQFQAELEKSRLRPDHQRSPRSAAVLLCRGLPPAIPCEKSGWLLWAERHWGVFTGLNLGSKNNAPGQTTSTERYSSHFFAALHLNAQFAC